MPQAAGPRLLPTYHTRLITVGVVGCTMIKRENYLIYAPVTTRELEHRRPKKSSIHWSITERHPSLDGNADLLSSGKLKLITFWS